MTKICIIPNVHGTGGMVSFKHKFSAGLAARGIGVTDNPDNDYDAMLVISGTRHLGLINKARKRGIRVVQRLDGINWLHRRIQTSVRYFVRAEIGNFFQSVIRARYADRIIYQSDFVRKWWTDWYGVQNKPFKVIHNGVDLSTYTPEGQSDRPTDVYRILLVEGSLVGGMSVGLDLIVDAAERVTSRYNLPVEVMVVGRVEESRQTSFINRGKVQMKFLGVVPREKIPQLDRSAHVYFSADINSACPNAAIEALACGLPVACFATGALPELVTEKAGRVVPYGANPWKLEPPDTEGLAYGIAQVLTDLPFYQHGARERALTAFGLERMIDRYIEVLLG